MAVPSVIFGNLAASVSDQLSQFVVAPNIFFCPSYPKFSKYERERSRFDQENFVLEYFSVDLDNALLSSNMNFAK